MMAVNSTAGWAAISSSLCWYAGTTIALETITTRNGGRLDASGDLGAADVSIQAPALPAGPVVAPLGVVGTRRAGGTL